MQRERGAVGGTQRRKTLLYDARSDFCPALERVSGMSTDERRCQRTGNSQEPLHAETRPG
jgi:hypothetical protein